jgi:hypothetical protein
MILGDWYLAGCCGSGNRDCIWKCIGKNGADEFALYWFLISH